MKNGDVFLRHILDVDEPVAGAMNRGYQFIELQVDGLGILVLASLNEEDHEKCDDGGTRIDDELPGIGVVEEGSADEPDHDDE